MNGRNKKILLRLLVCAVLLADLRMAGKPMEAHPGIRTALYIAVFFAAGWDVLLRARRSIKDNRLSAGSVLVTAAAVFAILAGKYAEGAEAMLIFRAGLLVRAMLTDGKLEEEDISPKKTKADKAAALSRNMGPAMLSPVFGGTGPVRPSEGYNDAHPSKGYASYGIRDPYSGESVKKPAAEKTARIRTLFTALACLAALFLAVCYPVVRFKMGQDPHWGIYVYRAAALLAIGSADAAEDCHRLAPEADRTSHLLVIGVKLLCLGAAAAGIAGIRTVVFADALAGILAVHNASRAMRVNSSDQ